MVNSLGEIIKDYELLVDLMQKQLDLLRENLSEDKLERFEELSQDWTRISLRIDQKVFDMGGYTSIPQHDQEIIRDLISKMEKLSFEINSSLAEQHNSDAETMKKVKMNQTTLRSYGGVGGGESIPLYFDERK